MLNTILLIIIALILLRINYKLPSRPEKDYVVEALERDRIEKEKRAVQNRTDTN
jgi:hypothetical protein